MTAPWVQTVSGVAFDLLAPTAEMVRVADIAHSLARINRFSGHTLGEPYSDAHHSMLVADILAAWGCPVPIVREALRAVVDEWYDEPPGRPIEGRDTLIDPLGRLTYPIDRVVRAALSLPEHESAIVKRADLVALAIERRDLPEYAPCGRLHAYAQANVAPSPMWREDLRREDLCSWSVARDRFTAYLAELDAQIAGST